jgi:cysteinyl-tRNA synthetase
MNKSALEELQEVEAHAKKLREQVTPDVTNRMAEIVKEINQLAAEGQALADTSRLQFDLSGLNFLPYGAGGLCYNPVKSEWDDEGWSSSSMGC